MTRRKIASVETDLQTVGPRQLIHTNSPSRNGVDGQRPPRAEQRKEKATSPMKRGFLALSIAHQRLLVIAYTLDDRLASLQDEDERWDIIKVNIHVAISISFGLEVTGLQDGNERWDIIKVDHSAGVNISL